MSGPDTRENALWWAEWSTAILLTLLVVLLHLSFLTHAGPLWRDEVNSVELATMGSWSSLYASLQFDPFPLLSPVFLRGWVNAGWGGSDWALRVFGFVVGVGFLGAVWLTVRLLRCPAPLLSLALLGLSPVVIRATDSVRPYGPGIVLIVITLGCLWKALDAPTAGRMVCAGVFGILSVQYLYQNASLLFGIYVAGMVVALREGRAKMAAAIGMLGVAAALSLVPYWSAITAARSWNVVNQSPTDIQRLLSVLMEALGSGGAVIGWVWIGLALFSCTAAIAGAALPKGGLTGQTERRLALFSVTAIMVATAGFLVTLQATGLPTQVWYYVPLMVTVGPVVDATVWAVTTSQPYRIGRLVLVLAIAGTATLPAWRGVQERRTNIDLAASLVGTQARPGDLVVVSPWYYGISFRRYYTGTARWVTLPPMDDIRIHRYDLLKTTMARSDPIDSVLEAMGTTLKSGHRVWLVGGLPFLNRGERPPPTLPPAPYGLWGWNNGPYLETWARQAAYFLQTHARGAETVPVSASGPVNPFENVPVVVVSGWR